MIDRSMYNIVGVLCVDPAFLKLPRVPKLCYLGHQNAKVLKFQKPPTGHRSNALACVHDLMVCLTSGKVKVNVYLYSASS